MIYFIHLNGDI